MTLQVANIFVYLHFWHQFAAEYLVEIFQVQFHETRLLGNFP